MSRKILLLLALGMTTVVAQTAPTFDVVSVRAVPEKEGVPKGYTLAPSRANGRLSWTTSPINVAMYAYNASAWRISGIKPDMSFITINATMSPAAAEEEIRAMFSEMLKERFGFLAHTEPREAAGYFLTVGKNGPKINAAGPEISPMPPYFRRESAEAFEGKVFISLEGPGTSAVTGRRVPIQKLADQLSGFLKVFVDDRTGLVGDYYFGFKFQQPDYVPTGTIDSAPALFDAIQESLGLKLEKAKRAVDFLVVDHIDKVPTEN